MSLTEFSHGPYTIKTIQRNGFCRARAFRDGVWLHEISDWTGQTVEGTVRRMRASLDTLDADLNEADDDLPDDAQPFCRLWSPQTHRPGPQAR